MAANGPRSGFYGYIIVFNWDNVILQVAMNSTQLFLRGYSGNPPIWDAWGEH